MPSLAAQRRKNDPVKGMRSEIADCMKELTKARREVVRLEEKLQKLLDRHLEIMDGVK